jgi:hypothetical protein
MWMNEGEIEQAIERFQSHPVLGKGARFLGAFRDEVNNHSDGWPYWQAPAKAAEKLMTLLHGHLFAGMGAYPRLAAPTEADLKEAIAPIKAFYTRHGTKAGMQFPSPDPKPKPVAPVPQSMDRPQLLRWLDEAFAVLTWQQIAAMAESMNLKPSDVQRGFSEASAEWEKIKDATASH